MSLGEKTGMHQLMHLLMLLEANLFAFPTLARLFIRPFITRRQRMPPVPPPLLAVLLAGSNYWPQPAVGKRFPSPQHLHTNICPIKSSPVERTTLQLHAHVVFPM